VQTADGATYYYNKKTGVRASPVTHLLCNHVAAPHGSSLDPVTLPNMLRMPFVDAPGLGTPARRARGQIPMLAMAPLRRRLQLQLQLPLHLPTLSLRLLLLLLHPRVAPATGIPW
jgi:hypothetical protein